MRQINQTQNPAEITISTNLFLLPLQELIILPSLLKKIGVHLELLTHIAEGLVTHLATLHG